MIESAKCNGIVIKLSMGLGTFSFLFALIVKSKAIAERLNVSSTQVETQSLQNMFSRIQHICWSFAILHCVQAKLIFAWPNNLTNPLRNFVLFLSHGDFCLTLNCPFHFWQIDWVKFFWWKIHVGKMSMYVFSYLSCFQTKIFKAYLK